MEGLLAIILAIVIGISVAVIVYNTLIIQTDTKWADKLNKERAEHEAEKMLLRAQLAKRPFSQEEHHNELNLWIQEKTQSVKNREALQLLLELSVLNNRPL